MRIPKQIIAPILMVLFLVGLGVWAALSSIHDVYIEGAYYAGAKYCMDHNTKMSYFNEDTLEFICYSPEMSKGFSNDSLIIKTS